MKEKPILFSGEMVRAILDGRKTQTRRIIKLDGLMTSETDGYDWEYRDKRKRWNSISNEKLISMCPYGSIGDKLWVRETHYLWGYWIVDTAFEPKTKTSFSCTDKKMAMYTDSPPKIHVAGGKLHKEKAWHKRQSIFMPRWASRITLEITNIGVERLQDISEGDAKAEGTTPSGVGKDLDYLKHRAGFMTLWDSLYLDSAPWDSDPWVWVIEFKRVTN